MNWGDKLDKITSKTVPLYAMIVLLVIFANPSWTSSFLGIIPIIAGEALRFWAPGEERRLTSDAHIQSPLYLGSFFMPGLCIWLGTPSSGSIFFKSYIPKQGGSGEGSKMFSEESQFGGGQYCFSQMIPPR